MSLNSIDHCQREQNFPGVSFSLSWAETQRGNRLRGNFHLKDNLFISQAENLVKKRGISMIVLQYSFSSVLPKKNRVFCIRWNSNFGWDLSRRRGMRWAPREKSQEALWLERQKIPSLPERFFFFFWIKLTASDGNVCFLAGSECVQCWIWFASLPFCSFGGTVLDKIRCSRLVCQYC